MTGLREHAPVPDSKDIVRRACESCGHASIARDENGRELGGGAHCAGTPLCWLCWRASPEGIKSMARLDALKRQTRARRSPGNASDTARTAMQKTRMTVDLNQIIDNPWQPRVAITSEDLEELAADIRELGLLQVPLARPSPTRPGMYELAFGHRRVAAIRLLRERVEWPDSMDLDVDGISDERMALIALSENVRRRDLSQIEIVRAHKRAIESTELTIQELSDKIGIARPTLSNNLRVLELPDFVLEHVESGDLSLSVAREFLVLQHDGHAHIEEMKRVVHNVSRVFGSRGSPDWTRRHVREQIYLRVSYNEQDWRPLGPKQPHHTVGGAHKEANFDVEAFKAEYPDSLHTIPAVSEVKSVNYEMQLICDSSRLWTCEVKEWSRRQSRATREANKEAAASGQTQASKKDNDAASQLGEILGQDPVWKLIASGRETGKKGPHRPVNDQERELLGTRAVLKEIVDYGSGKTGFHKLLSKAKRNEYPGRWQDNEGGVLPPFFPDLDECHRCVAGAAYAKRRYNSGAILACFNKRCYSKKFEAGAAVFREKLEARKKDLFREDREAAQRFASQLMVTHQEALMALATTLVAQTERLELQHPFGRPPGDYVEGWSYEAGATTRVREILGMELRTGRNGVHYLDDQGLEALERVDRGELRELVANLMVHHLRQAGKLEAVSQGTES